MRNEIKILLYTGNLLFQYRHFFSYFLRKVCKRFLVHFSELVSVEGVIPDVSHEVNGALQDTQFEYTVTLRVRNTAAHRLVSLGPGKLLLQVELQRKCLVFDVK